MDAANYNGIKTTLTKATKKFSAADKKIANKWIESNYPVPTQVTTVISNMTPTEKSTLSDKIKAGNANDIVTFMVPIVQKILPRFEDQLVVVTYYNNKLSACSASGQ